MSWPGKRRAGPSAITGDKPKPMDADRAIPVRIPAVGIEPTRGYPQRILSPQRLPFRHAGWIRNRRTNLPGFAISRKNGGGGIRTHGRLSPTTVFKTVPIDHSGTPPDRNADRPTRTECQARPAFNCRFAIRATDSRALYWPLASSRISSATKIGTSTVTASAIASLGRESTSTSSPSCRIRNLAK